MTVREIVRITGKDFERNISVKLSLIVRIYWKILNDSLYSYTAYKNSQLLNEVEHDVKDFSD